MVKFHLSIERKKHPKTKERNKHFLNITWQYIGKHIYSNRKNPQDFKEN